MFEKVPTTLDFVSREKEVIAFWKQNKIFEQSMQLREGGPEFSFFDGPPTANGKPHIGHILTRVIKDIIPRYRTMKGYHVLRKAGWDTHGLPVELEVEKQLKISGKPQIEQYGVEPFIQKCKESVFKYQSEWEKMSDRVGYWVDMDNPYVTYDNNYIESVWWSIKQIWDKGLLYKGHKVVPYCPRCGTALSSHEVAQGYQDVKEMSAFVRFAVVGQKGVSLLAWTTTPWTLPSNVGLCVNAKEDYAFVKLNDETLIMAKALVESVIKDDAYTIEKTVKGKELEGMSYCPIFDYAKNIVGNQKCWQVVSDSYVTLTDGTGIVHLAPAFGEDDARVCAVWGLPMVQLVDEQGKFLAEATHVSGMFVKDADVVLLDKMLDDGSLFAKIAYEHSYPFCWRCDTPLIYYARSTWFVRVTQMKESLLRNNDHVHWMPDNIREGRMGNFLQNVIDWGLSRERYWGTPLPIWVCDCGHMDAVGSIEQLKANSPNCPDQIELHKPFIDAVHLNCPKCGGLMKRVAEVIDCWYDSGAMPFAQWHYPFENQDKFEATFPADFISEAVDQTRGWFYTLLAISTLLFDKAPFENCIVLGHVNDKEGQKMSKHKGNVVDPWSVLDKQGADAVRWYFYTGSSPWLPSRFYDEAVSEAQRKFMGTLWNTYAFFALYASVDGFDIQKVPHVKEDRTLMDEWVLCRLNHLIDFVDNGLSDYKITETSRAIAEFVDDLSNWYVRLGRDRFWGEGMNEDKAIAYHTLYTCLKTVALLSAPFVPFMAETMYQNLVRAQDDKAPISVHLCDYPVADKSLIDDALITQMQEVMRIVSAGRAARNNAAMKVRQPLQRLYVQAEAPLSQAMTDLIADELNVKQVVYTKDSRGYTTYQLKPQLRTLGKKYGKFVPVIGAALAEMDGNSVMDTLTQDGMLKFSAEGENFELLAEDILSERIQKPGYVAVTEGNCTVALDITLTQELIREGYVREVISKIQTQRKEAGFSITDRITITYEGGEEIVSVFSQNQDEIAQTVLAVNMAFGAPSGFVKEWDINGLPMKLGVSKV